MAGSHTHKIFCKHRRNPIRTKFLYYAEVVQRGEYLIIRVDGTEQRVKERPTLEAVYRAIGCGCIDVVNLDRKRPPEIVMMVDDTGMLDHKPVNAKATALAQAAWKAAGRYSPYSIHGDVAIVHDQDFE